MAEQKAILPGSKIGILGVVNVSLISPRPLVTTSKSGCLSMAWARARRSRTSVASSGGCARSGRN